MLVALAISGTVVGLLLQIFGVGLRNVALSADYSRAALHAQSLLNRLGVDLDLGDDSPRSGAFADGMRWQLTLTPIALPLPETLLDSAKAELRRVEVTVSWGEGESPRQLALTTARLVTHAEN